MVPLLHIDGLTWSYPGSSKKLFDDFSCSVQPGELVFITGTSGAGKTTLTRFITGEITPPVDSVYFHRQDIARLSSKEIQAYRRRIGIVFQDFKLLEWKTVRENILFPLQLETSNKETLQEALDGVCDLLDIVDILHVYPKQLSGGEKQRAAIARALIRKPEFLIMDEPTGNIDDTAAQSLMHECFRLHDHGVTIIFVTHDTPLIAYTEKKGITHQKLSL